MESIGVSSFALNQSHSVVLKFGTILPQNHLMGRLAILLDGDFLSHLDSGKHLTAEGPVMGRSCAFPAQKRKVRHAYHSLRSEQSPRRSLRRPTTDVLPACL